MKKKTSIIQNQIEIQEIIAISIYKNISSQIESRISELGKLAKTSEIQKDTGTSESTQTRIKLDDETSLEKTILLMSITKTNILPLRTIKKQSK